jgi:enoyl-[acyl-carrier protein] reductase I
VFDTLKEKWGTIDFLVHAIAFSDKSELRGRLCRHQPGEFHPAPW